MKPNAQFLPSTLSKLITTACLLALGGKSFNAFATQEVKAERWFEVEVILFEQLGDKNALKEQFADDVSVKTLPEYKRSFDLLSSYLQPDLTAIKQFVQLCSNNYGKNVYSLSQKELALLLPEQTHFIQQANDFKYEPIALTLFEEVEHAQQIEQVENTNKSELSETVQDDVSTEFSSSQTNVIQTTQQYDWQTETLESTMFSTEQLCVYSQQDFEDILDEQQLDNFNLHGFPVDALPKKLNASGLHTRSKPYLIANDSLLLKDISKRLRWSKEFKPLLHFGWRQVGITRNKAIPLKLFAGHHIENDYQQALTQYQVALKESLQQEQLRQEESKTGHTVTNDELLSWESLSLPEENERIEAEYYAQVQQQNYKQLFNDIDTFEKNGENDNITDEIVKQSTKQNLHELLTHNKIIIDNVEQGIDKIIPPIKPLQPWYLDGFFKVHLDHYLYITADFNLFNKSPNNKDINSSNPQQLKLINISQDRRVITGEIHYFDHPYIGMIVQIRRFDPSKPADEAVSQAIK